ncbi:MAG: PD-(D/E)XK nuclease family protein [Selenomonadaceae bacterium]|nr:PD-(D/E)XK nuclease family protein [Selenomonadaceae bacterium]
MLVEIIIGRAGSGKTFACLNQMKKILSESPLDTKIIFILPAYQTYREEIEFAEITGGSVNTVMWSFQRFARQILIEKGGAIIPRISEIGRRILLRKILMNHSKIGDLKFYKRAARQRGFAENLADELKELRAYSISAEKLHGILNKISNAELADKISDLAVLCEDFRKTIDGKQNDESDLLEKAADLIKFSSEVKTSEIFIDGYIFFDLQQRKFLNEIFKYAKNVHITLPMDTDIFCGENKNELGIFNRSFKTFEMLKKSAENLGVDVKITKCTENKRFESEELKFIEENIFRRTQKIFPAENKNFKIVEAVNKRVEVEAAAQEILKIHREKNFRFREIGIITRDESYNNLLKNIFEIHKIPFFIDGNRSAVHHPFSELIRSTLEIFRGWKIEPIFRSFRTGFFDISAEEIDLLENYVIEFGIRGEKIWTQSENWTKHKHRLGKSADEDFNEREKNRLEKVNEIRKKISEPLLNFSKAVKKKKTAREFSTALYNFFEELKIYDKLSEMSETEEKRGNLSLSKENLKIWDDVINLLEQIAENLGDDEIDAKEFEMIINEGLDALEMSIIPPGLDNVTISQFDQNSLQNSRAIFILGFNDSNFPKKADEKYLLSDVDRLHLTEDYGIEISLGGREKLFAEKFLFYRGITEAKNFLYLSYSLADSEGRAMSPAKMIEKFKNFFSIKNIEQATLEILNNFGSEIDLLLEEKNLSAKTAKELFAPHRKISGSVTKFENFNSCPFKFFANYGLKLKEREEYKIQVPDIGEILHYVMRKFGEDLKSENKNWRDVEEKELKNRVEKIVDEVSVNVKNKILSSKNSYIHRKERIKKVAVSSLKRLIDWNKVSNFQAEFFEKDFDKIFEYKIDGVEIELSGIIDRIDLSEDDEQKYFLIIDYKTGKAYLDLNEIFAGVNLQLTTYLAAAKSLNEVGEKIPAAMLYYFLKYPAESGENLSDSTKKIDKNLKMEGWILNSENVVFEVDESLNFVKVQFNANGQPNKNTLKSTLKSSEVFEKVMDWTNKIFKQTCENILNGNISVEPFQSNKKSACDFCTYSELCGFNPKTDEYKTLNLDEEEILKRMGE